MSQLSRAGGRALRVLMATDCPLPIKTIRICLDAPCFPRFVVQTWGPTSLVRVARSYLG